MIFDKSKFTRTSEGGVSSFVYDNDKVYVENAPFSEKELKQFEAYQADYYKDLATVATDIAKDEFKKHKDIEKISVEAGYSTKANGYIVANVWKNIETTNRFTGEQMSGSKVKVVVHDPADIHKTFCKNLQKELTDSLK